MRPEIISQLQSSGAEWIAVLVPTSGSLYALALIVLAFVFIRRSASVGLSRNRAVEFVLAATAGALVGTRLFYLITTGGLLSVSVGDWFNLSRGTASWGAYLGGMVGALLYTRFAGLNRLACIDTAASGVAIGPFVGRWSCFLAGDDFGRISDAPWALQFPAGSLPFQSHVAADLIPSTAPASRMRDWSSTPSR